MDHNSDFSFQKFPTKEEDESPKPMPGAPILPNKDSIGRDSASISVKKDDQPSQLLPYSIVEVLESLTISPASSMSKTQTSQPATVVPLPPPNMLSSQVTATTSNSSRRAKIPLERGFTQVDWMKLTRTHPNLAGLNGGSNQRLIPMEEVRQHKSEENAWTIFRGKVYNITHYLKFHPGGKDKLMQGAGKDCTTLFNKYHAWVNAEFLLEKCLVGHLDVSALNNK